MCSGASGTIGEGSCIAGDDDVLGETCVDLNGIVGTNSVRHLMCSY